jgi:protein TonB
MYPQLLHILCLLLLPFAAHSQQLKDSIPPPRDTTYKVIVQVEARFPGGTDAWIKHVQKTIDPREPFNRSAPAGEYVVIASFIVTKDGRVRKVQPETEHGFSMEKQLMYAIDNGPRWIPATQDGIPVDSHRRESITFIVPERKPGS